MTLSKLSYIITVLLLLFSERSMAQLQSVQIAVNGLTCSQCSRSVEMSIRKLDFVKEVRMNLEHTEGEVLFNEGIKVDIAKIAKAVVDAGFSVRYLKAKIYFRQVPVSENYCWINDHTNYQFIKIKPKELSGIITVTFIGAQFMPKKEYKKWLPVINAAKGKGCEAKQVYFISEE